MKIILIVGPSGAGKDTLLQLARKHYNGDSKMAFVKRFITRPPDHNEQNYYVDHQTFHLLKHHNHFIADWQAHGHLYGVSTSSLQTDNRVFFISVSRSAIEEFEQHYKDVTTLLITADLEVLQNRLISRGREGFEAVRKRLERAKKDVQARNLITFNNSYPLDVTSRRFIGQLDKIVP